MRIDELVENVGTEFKDLDENGKALGCMLPIYLLYPDLPRFDQPPINLLNDFMRVKFREIMQEVQLSEIKPGDIVLLNARRFVHPAVYLGNDRLIHCLKETGIETMRLSLFSRVEGVYRACRG